MISRLISSINPFQKAIQKQILGKREDIQVEIGSSNLLVNGIRNFLSIPSKILMFNSRFNSGAVSKKTIEKAKDYLHEHGLHDVSISINQYKPQAVWRRIFTNPKTSLLSKLTLGIVDGIIYTLSCNKLSGVIGDNYSPAQNTLHIFSNDSSVALHECGHAKDFNERENPSLYTATAAAPHIINGFVPLNPVLVAWPVLYREFKASNNAIYYLNCKGNDKKIRKAFTTLVPAFATYVTTTLPWPNVQQILANPEMVRKWLPNYLLKVSAIVIAGYALGRFMASRVGSTPVIQGKEEVHEEEVHKLEKVKPFEVEVPKIPPSHKTVHAPVG